MASKNPITFSPIPNSNDLMFRFHEEIGKNVLVIAAPPQGVSVRYEILENLEKNLEGLDGQPVYVLNRILMRSSNQEVIPAAQVEVLARFHDEASAQRALDALMAVLAGGNVNPSFRGISRFQWVVSFLVLALIALIFFFFVAFTGSSSKNTQTSPLDSGVSLDSTSTDTVEAVWNPSLRPETSSSASPLPNQVSSSLSVSGNQTPVRLSEGFAISSPVHQNDEPVKPRAIPSQEGVPALPVLSDAAASVVNQLQVSSPTVSASADPFVGHAVEGGVENKHETKPLNESLNETHSVIGDWDVAPVVPMPGQVTATLKDPGDVFIQTVKARTLSYDDLAQMAPRSPSVEGAQASTARIPPAPTHSPSLPQTAADAFIQAAKPKKD